MQRNSLILVLILVSSVAIGQQGNLKLNGAVNREGGIMTLLKACEPLQKGHVVAASNTVSLGIERAVTSSYDPVGIVYFDDVGSSTVASGAWCWITHSGPAQVLVDVAASAGQMIITSTTPGYSTAIPKPPPPPTTNDHFREVGHLLESVSVATIAWAIVHWN